ncbi:acetylornithine carbamoyltransferase [Flavobacterium sp. JP2137]|uniref:acetylornithine carbamoyltransferase n=1 Tax=Flavobacterium sp. JP2137 TaxID=3414510 RepID=UPI003D2FB0EE
MKQFFSVRDIDSISAIVKEALELKANPFAHEDLGRRKTLGLVFLNPSLRTRMSTQKAALQLGMQVMMMNLNQDGWALETQDGVVMNGSSVEHIREAAAVMGTYCDVLGLRSFPGLQDREQDYSEWLFKKFRDYSRKPLVSLESATLHPLQSLADVITILEHQKPGVKPKVVLSWAPHVKPLPQAVANSFSEWMCQAKKEGLVDFVIAHPEGYRLAESFTTGAKQTTDQREALEGADFVYVKNWSSYDDYGGILPVKEAWMLDQQQLKITNQAKVMHCLPVRRDLELASDILDSSDSLVIAQAANRVWSAQVVLKRLLTDLKTDL